MPDFRPADRRLLTDLKARGLLDTTLVVWGGEFGRTPFNEKGKGRDHNPWGFTIWMAGGGVKGGQTIGTTDEIGLRVVERRAHVHDIHATILHLLGLNHVELTYFHNGRFDAVRFNSEHITDTRRNPYHWFQPQTEFRRDIQTFAEKDLRANPC